jgi:hypothetical protein
MRDQGNWGIRATVILAAACGAVVLSGSAATAQVIFGLPTGVTGAPGAEVDFAFTATGDSAPDVNNGQFLIACDPQNPAFEPVTTDGTTMNCTTTSSLQTLGFSTTAFLLEAGVCSITVADAVPPLQGYGDLSASAGVITTCKFKIKDAAEEGEVAIPCSEIPPFASNAAGLDIPASCTDGSLTIGPALPETPTPTVAEASPTPTETPLASQYGGCSYEGSFSLEQPVTDVSVQLACSFDGKITGAETLAASEMTLVCTGDCDTETGALSNVECVEAGGGFAGCYQGQWDDEVEGTAITLLMDVACSEGGAFSGGIDVALQGGTPVLGTLDCSGSCDTQTGALADAACSGNVAGTDTTVGVSGTLPAAGATGPLTFTVDAESADHDVTNVPCNGGAQSTQAISSQISGTLPVEGGTGPLTFTFDGASGDHDVSNTECLAPPTPTATSGGGEATATPTQGFSQLISESGCNVITPNSTGGTPWALIIPAAALLVFRRRRR